MNDKTRYTCNDCRYFGLRFNGADFVGRCFVNPPISTEQGTLAHPRVDHKNLACKEFLLVEDL